MVKTILMSYLYFKSLHLIFMVCWFAGLFYLVRLFIYFKESEKKPELERTVLEKQFTLMTKRLLYIITWPSAILTTIFGWSMIYINTALLDNQWMKVKLCFVFFLLLYTYFCQLIFNQMKIGKITFKSGSLRIFNEVATVFLFSIIFLAVLRTTISWLLATIGLILLAVILMILIKLYKKISS